MHTYVSDSGGVERLPKKIYVSDSGATVRFAKKIYVSDPGGVTRLVFTSGYAFTIIAGVSGSNTGYANGLATGGGVYGSITTPPGGGLVSGRVIAAIFDSGSTGAELVISNFGSDPGQASLNFITINGQTFTGATASYSFGSAFARWTWTNFFGLANGSTYSGFIASSGAW